MPRRVSLKTVVSPDQRVPPEDLGQVRFALSRLGLFDPARDPNREESLMGAGMRRALGAFQAGQGLREDAVLRPRGPTEQRLNLLLEQDKGLRVADQDDSFTRDRQAARERTPGALVGRVGPGLENHPDDVAAVSTVLRRLGHIKPGAPNPAKTGEVFGGLEDFQRQNGLARDATITPDGPTEQLLVQQLSAPEPGPQGIGTTTPLIDATETLFQNGPAEPRPESVPTDRQRPSSVRPSLRGRRPQPRQADEAVNSPQLSVEQRETQRQDALQMLDRILQRDRGEPLDTSSDQAGTAFMLRKFLDASPEEQGKAREFLRQREEPSPAPDRANPAPNEGFTGAMGSSLFTRRQAPLLPDRPLKGTSFFPGAGMAGRYIPDVIDALKESGIANARAVGPEVWSNGSVPDLASIPTERDQDGGPSDLTRFGTEGDQFNLIGFSYGGFQAAQAAADYADFGGKVDHLVLIGTPISGKFLTSLQGHPNIGAVKVIDLQDKGDPTRAGADFEEFGSTIPELIRQSVPGSEGGRGDSDGHFYYTGNGDEEEGQRRRRTLARELFDFGLR